MEESLEKTHLSTESDSDLYNFHSVLKDLNDIDNGVWDLNEFDKDLINWTDSQYFGQTEYQNRYFVVNSQVTPWRQIRQAIMEVQTRLNGLQKVTINYKRSLNDIARVKKEMEEEENPFYKQDKQYELELLMCDKQIYMNKVQQCKYEISGLLKIIKEHTNGVEDLEVLSEGLLNKENEELEEHKYWIARMAKQCSLDLLTTGRIQAGNLDSMLMMCPEDQAAVTDLAMTYSTAMNINIGKIKAAAEEKVEKMLEGQGPQMFETNGVLTDYASNNITDRFLQSSDQPQT
tara:strand:+ start:3332 stop:4198 length:867 start_codon:yes stop_codon:yes gene_type:complete